MAEANSKQQIDNRKFDIEREKLDVERDNQKNDLEIAKINARNKNKPGK